MSTRKLSDITEEERRANDPLRDFYHNWHNISKADVRMLDRALKNAENRDQMISFFRGKPHLLIQHLCGGHGRWVINQECLSSEYSPDFLVGHAHSFGYEWQAIVLESPNTLMYRGPDNPSDDLQTAIDRLSNWHTWLGSNDLHVTIPGNNEPVDISGLIASRRISRHGESIILNDPNASPGAYLHIDYQRIILIGRRQSNEQAQDTYRNRMQERHNIIIHSFDYILDACRTRAREIPIEIDLTQMNKCLSLTRFRNIHLAPNEQGITCDRRKAKTLREYLKKHGYQQIAECISFRQGRAYLDHSSLPGRIHFIK